MPTRFISQFHWILVTLAFASMLSVGLFVARVCVSWNLNHAYLVWNLFLAWLPLGFALMAWRSQHRPRRCMGFAILWLLFFPNAPYLVTDLVHLRERPPVPFWFDIVLLQSFIWVGLLVGFISLYCMQALFAKYTGRRSGWLFVFTVIGLTGFGIYLGRVQRWNSWDALLNPIDLVSDMAGLLVPPRRRGAGLFTILYAAFLFAGYLVFYNLARMNSAIRILNHPKVYGPRNALTPQN